MDNVLSWFEENQEAILLLVGKIAVALIILVVGFMLAKFISRSLSKRLGKSSVDNAVVSFIAAIVRTIIVIAALLMALSHVGIQTTSFIAILGAAGLAIGLALQGSLSNFASGVLIMIYRPFKSGDYVDAGGIAGSVEKIELFTTVLKTPDNKKVIVPNSRITGSEITNFTEEPTRRVDMVIGVSYSANLQKTKQVLLDVINADERTLPTPAPNVAVSALGDSSVNFIVRPWVKSEDYWPYMWENLEKIKDKLDENGIGIPFPQMDVHIQKDD
ncbi:MULTISPECIES: mechanosensitive ion channel family protein [Gammaproteobacteria]|uniref:mechanosensitive ion channel family protein n=1 Tax=Gammaproteobacteria TaxID=1236 RepID=UPI000DCFF989|nr:MULTISPECIES: mechanosensitive ion channel domain-containing protein [Gammaproteobacteria]RTE86194.1 mechanosensitive ion channel [Aliidiomarina sp. B3213]TCZ91546.1 mechanosensitive ion channel [Lysobacter sp. N42]